MKLVFFLLAIAAASGAYAQDSGTPPVVFANGTATDNAAKPPAPTNGQPVIFVDGTGDRLPPAPVVVPDIVRVPAPPRTTVICANLTSHEASLNSLHANVHASKRPDKALLDTALASYRKHACSAAPYASGSIVVIDFARRSHEPRLWLIDLTTGKGLDAPVVVTHGIGSDYNDDGVLDRFSNTYNSLASSPGAARGAEVYYGKNGRSLRLDGLDATNSEIRRRDIVVHSVSPRTRTYFRADYVAARNGVLGTSEGCFVVEPELRDWLIDSLAGGGFLYAGASGERGAAMMAALTAPPPPARLPDGTQVIFADGTGQRSAPAASILPPAASPMPSQ